MTIEEIPRRIILDLNTPEELLIRKATEEIEKLGADELLTDCVILLSEAKNKLSDWVDKQKV